MVDGDVQYSVSAVSRRGHATIEAMGEKIDFDASDGRTMELPGPAELFASAFAGCTLKNVERFSHMLEFSYEEASITVTAIREVEPPRITEIRYHLVIDTDEPDRRIDLLRRNIEKFGTIYNTVAAACDVVGVIEAKPKEGTA